MGVPKDLADGADGRKRSVSFRPSFDVVKVEIPTTATEEPAEDEDEEELKRKCMINFINAWRYAFGRLIQFFHGNRITDGTCKIGTT